MSGVVPPINLDNASVWAAKAPFPEYEFPYSTVQYYPLGITLATAGSGGGAHSYIGIVAEWSARWWLDQQPAHVRQTRIFALDGEAFPFTTILNEATGRIPTINNGAPVGTGPGAGTTYTGMGSLYPHLSAPGVSGDFQDVAEPRSRTPEGAQSDTVWWFGAGPPGVYNDHQGAYNYYPFPMFGDRHWLDLVRMQGNRSGTITFDTWLNGPSSENRPNRSFTFPAASGTPPAGQTYRGILYYANTHSQGIRAAAWMLRSLSLAAAFGADGEMERQYFNDILKENYNYWLAMKAHKDCSAPGTPQPDTWSSSPLAGVISYYNQGFMNTYNVMAKYVAAKLINDPLALDQFNHTYLAAYQSLFGTSGWPDSTPPIYGGGFWYYVWGDFQKSAYGEVPCPLYWETQRFRYS